MTDTVRFQPYTVCSSNRTLDEIVESTNRNCYLGYGSVCAGEWGRIRSNPVQAYHRFLRQLLQRDDAEIVPFRQILSTPRRSDRLQIVIRHDVDIDIVAALAQAKIEADLGVRTTYFCLHTSPYHAEYRKGKVYRNDAVLHLYTAIQELGHEIALHNDSMLVYQDWHMDGAAALKTELEWMRTGGLDVVGTVQHNSVGLYGVENYEIFVGRNTPTWKPVESGDFKRDGLLRYKGKYARYHCLDEKELGLLYEGTDVFSYGEGRIEYGATRHLNRWRWDMHLERYRENSRLPNEWFCDEDTVIRDILSLPAGTMVVLTIHPCYYACRHGELHSPVMIRQDRREEQNKELGWKTCRPDSIHCNYLADGLESRQSINPSNELGMLDFDWPGTKEDNESRVLVLGGEHFDAPHLGFEANCHAVCERLLRAALEDKTVYVRKLAFPLMGLDRLWGWYRRVADRYQPDFVVLPMGPGALFDSLPVYWQPATGVSSLAWSGSGLAWDPDNEAFVEREMDADWYFRRMSKRRPLAFTMPEWNAIASNRDLSDKLNLSALGYMELLYTHVVHLFHQEGVKCVFVYDGPATYWDDENDCRTLLGEKNEIAGRIVSWCNEFANVVKIPLVMPPLSEQDHLPYHSNGLWTAAHHLTVGILLYKFFFEQLDNQYDFPASDNEA